MEIVERRYADADLPRLQETVAGWIAEAGRCGYDHIGELPHRIYENLRGRATDEHGQPADQPATAHHGPPSGGPVRLWEAGDEIVGVAICGRFGEAFDVFAAPALRGTGAECHMLDTAAAGTAELIAPGGYVLTDVWSCDEHRIRLLTELGFEHFRTWDHVRERELTGALPDPVVPPGFRVRSATIDDAERLAAVHNESFDSDWTGDTYRAAVMVRPGYDPAREVVAEAPDGRLAAYTVYWTDGRNRAGHFEPVGTSRHFRRLGLARAIMLESMRRMRDAGLTSVSVNHNADNKAALRLYESLGFARTHDTYGFRRPR
ncbi:GNAT family N-acetyltransferase [Plantactinospora sp. GCM10030261]|uniref:GNAT family N-acetyltransferase n=1 Tax=Plantactinospora sp. GCM10030261 TaxID=3273420 RepID=UPI00361238BB